MTDRDIIERLREVRCEGCGSHWTDDDLALVKRANPKVLSCCPERKPLTIDEWMARAVRLTARERVLVKALEPLAAIVEQINSIQNRGSQESEQLVLNILYTALPKIGNVVHVLAALTDGGGK